MKTIALRFAENFAPECGTINAHQQVIDTIGHVWYGKMGSPISSKMIEVLKEQSSPRILLIHSGKAMRYWAFISDVQRETPPLKEIPEYYRYSTEKFKTWFKIIRFEQAPKDVMSKCYVASSKSMLNEASKHSMSPYFIIETGVMEVM